MRQHSLLRWIEQAEARKVTDAAVHEQIMLTSPEFQPRATPVTQRGRSRRRVTPMTLLRRWRPSRIANDIC
jgi:hypothetical protein